METYDPISREEASAALAETRRSRFRAAWSGYPAWYWLITGACLGAGSYAVWLPTGWDVGVCVVIAATLVAVARVAGRVRGVCVGWLRIGMSPQDSALLYGPAVVLILANSVVGRFVPWWPIAGAVLVFALFAGTGLMFGARAARS